MRTHAASLCSAGAGVRKGAGVNDEIMHAQRSALLCACALFLNGQIISCTSNHLEHSHLRIDVL